MEHINWLAYAAAVVVQVVVGYVWFLPGVMGNYWAKANGKTFEEMTPQNAGMTYGLTILLTLLFTFFLLINVTGPGQEADKFGTFQHGIGHGVFLTLLVVTPIFGTVTLFEKRGLSWLIVHGGYWFLRIALAGGILSMWR
jgi:hypothetical protein